MSPKWQNTCFLLSPTKNADFNNYQKSASVEVRETSGEVSAHRWSKKISSIECNKEGKNNSFILLVIPCPRQYGVEREFSASWFLLWGSEGMWVNIQVLQLCRMLPQHPIYFYPIQNSEVCQVTGGQRAARSGGHQRDTDPTNNCMGSIRKPIPKPLAMPLLQIPPTVLQAPLTFCKTHPHTHTPILWPAPNAHSPWQWD